MNKFDTLLLELTEVDRQHNNIILQIKELADTGDRDAKIFLTPYRARIAATQEVDHER